jgi:hypothetical protein
MATHGTVDVWLDRVKDSAPIIRMYAAKTEEKRRLSRPVVDAMLQAGQQYSRFSKSLRVSRRTDTGGGVRLGLLCFVSIQYSLCPNTIP